ncbi:MAG: hypothetical protein IPP46_18215 [Bacteroidetes bacterium]|nr:hypothetical protein [Bacteroidota bacterium]
MSNPNVLHAGCENGGIYKSIDKGLTWQYKSLQEEMTSALFTLVKFTPPMKMMSQCLL